MGLIGAAGALGGVGINLAFRQPFLPCGSGTGAFVAFLAFLAFLAFCGTALRGHLGRIPSPPGRRSPGHSRRVGGEAAARLGRSPT